jgi:hypothetical protein
LNLPLLDLRQITRETLDLVSRATRIEPLLPGSGPARDVPRDPAAPAPTDEPQKSRGRDPRLGSDPSLGIALEAAPEYFFDQDRWNEFISDCGCREKALRNISYPDPADLIVLRRKVAQQQTSAGVQARAKERVYRLGQSLSEDFRSGLISGEYIATGFQAPSIQRVTIPPELHRDLNYNFEIDEAKGGGYIFSHIRIVKTRDIERQESDVSSQAAIQVVERRARQGREWPHPGDDAGRFEHPVKSASTAGIKVVSGRDLRAWYEKRIEKLSRAGRTSSGEEDWAAAREQFPNRVTRARVRSIRDECTPVEWRKQGRHKAKTAE